MRAIKKIKEFAVECKRVLKVTRKPGSKEFKTTLKITGLGILLIGFIGFIVQLVHQTIIR